MVQLPSSASPSWHGGAPMGASGGGVPASTSDASCASGSSPVTDFTPPHAAADATASSRIHFMVPPFRPTPTATYVPHVGGRTDASLRAARALVVDALQRAGVETARRVSACRSATAGGTA